MLSLRSLTLLRSLTVFLPSTKEAAYEKISTQYGTFLFHQRLFLLKEKPFEVDDGLAEKLLKTGRFTELQAVVAEEMSFMPQSEETEDVPVETENQEEDKEPEEDLTAAKVAKMRNDELIALAERKGINLDGCKKHDEYVERIQGALGLVDFSALNWD